MSATRVLVAGLGNELFADDGFGLHVIAELRRRALPPQVELELAGVRALDLAFRMMEGYALVVLVDALAWGRGPGTVLAIDPALGESVPLKESHGVDPTRMIDMVRAACGSLPEMRIVGCEPARIVAGEQILHRGLSPAVEAAVPVAASLVEELVGAFLADRPEVRARA